MTPFKALYGRDPPTVPQYHVGTSPVNEVDKALLTRDELLAQFKRNLAVATNRMKQTADKHRRDVHFHKDDLVFLKLHPYRQISVFKRAYQKLASKILGPIMFWKKSGPSPTNYSCLLVPVFIQCSMCPCSKKPWATYPRIAATFLQLMMRVC